MSKPPPPGDQPMSFKKDLFFIVNKIKFTNFSNSLKQKNEVLNIKKKMKKYSLKMTGKYYKINIDTYDRLYNNKVTKFYKKCPKVRIKKPGK